MAQSTLPGTGEKTSEGLPNLRDGIASRELAEGRMLVGTFDGENVLVARRDGEVFAVEATCTHYGGPLQEGLLVGDTVRYADLALTVMDTKGRRLKTIKVVRDLPVEEEEAPGEGEPEPTATPEESGESRAAG